MNCRGPAIWSLCLAVCVVVPARAHAAERLPITAASPENGSIEARQGALAFKLSTIDGLLYPWIDVASQGSVGAEGELESGFTVERVGLEESREHPGTYSGTALYPLNMQGWSFTPGTYYWQLRGAVASRDELRLHEALGPVYTLVIVPLETGAPQGEPAFATPESPPSPSLTPAESYPRVKALIKEKTGHSAHHLSDRCLPRSQVQVACATRWLSAWPTSSRTFRYSGSFVLEAQPGSVQISFFGRRERQGCRGKRCAASVRWVHTGP